LHSGITAQGIKQGSVCIYEGGCNVLTLDIPTSRLSNGCAANSALVRIEKYIGVASTLTAFMPPKNAYPPTLIRNIEASITLDFAILLTCRSAVTITIGFKFEDIARLTFEYFT